MRYNLVGLSSIVPVFSSTLFRTPDTNFYVSAVSASLVHAMLAHPDIEVRFDPMYSAVLRGLLCREAPSESYVLRAADELIRDVFSGAIDFEGGCPRDYRNTDIVFDCGPGFFRVRQYSERGKKMISHALKRLEGMMAAADGAKVDESVPENVHQLAYRATFQSIRETCPDVTPEQLTVVRAALALYADKLKQYAGMGKDGLESARHGVIRETTDADRPLVTTAMSTYYKLAQATAQA
jgi:hypothetical protein